MKKRSIVILAVAGLVSLFSLSGCFLFAPSSEIKIVNGYPAINDPGITSISVTGEDGSKNVVNYEPEYTKGIFTFSCLPGGYNASTSVFVYDVKKYTITVNYEDHGSGETTAGSTSAEINVENIGDMFTLLFTEDEDGNPSLTLQETDSAEE